MQYPLAIIQLRRRLETSLVSLLQRCEKKRYNYDVVSKRVEYFCLTRPTPYAESKLDHMVKGFLHNITLSIKRLSEEDQVYLQMYPLGINTIISRALEKATWIKQNPKHVRQSVPYAKKIQKQWRESISNPNYKICRVRLSRELAEMNC